MGNQLGITTGIFLFLILTGGVVSPGAEEAILAPDGVHRGISRDTLFTIFALTDERTYRVEGATEWITFNYRIADQVHLLTVVLTDNVVIGWKYDNRAEVIEEYVSEFCSQAILASYPTIASAIRDVLLRLPFDIFLKVTDRARPMVFTEYHSDGAARYANSSDIYVLPADPPTFNTGIWLVKLNTILERPLDQAAVTGIVAHEIAHRVLEHSREDEYLETFERQANALICEWGFQEEFEKARTVFGQ